MSIKTIKDIENLSDPKWLDQFSYQENLTRKLDMEEGDFDQNIINEILLWKVNRYAELSADDLKILNKLDREQSELDEEFTRKIL